MAELPQVLTHPETGAVWELPACGPETDAVYASMGWVPAPEGTPAPDPFAVDAPVDTLAPAPAAAAPAAPVWGATTSSSSSSDTKES